jgi:RES domain-containing protein
MAGRDAPRDNRLIDALEAIEPVMLEQPVWRATQEGRDPCRCSRSGGRWDDGTFDVLYTAEVQDGAIAEMYFHLSRGQPIMPSQVRYELHEINAMLSHALKLVDTSALAALGLNVEHYGQLSYQEREMEYPRSQDIAEAAHFLNFDGLIVPSARWNCMNIVLFCEKLSQRSYQATRNHGIITWSEWASDNS